MSNPESKGKQINFCEAYEMNKTRRVKEVNGLSYWEVGQMQKREVKKTGKCKWEQEYILAKWIVEPERFQALVAWTTSRDDKYYPMGVEGENVILNEDFKRFNGKKTIITIEVIE